MSFILLTKQPTPPSAPAAGKIFLFGDNAAFPRAKVKDESGNISALLAGEHASSIAAVTGYAADTYLAGSGITIPAASDWRAGSFYKAEFDMVKTAAGIAAFTINVRMGTLGTTADTLVLALAFAVGTAAADTGFFEVRLVFRAVGGAAIIQGIALCHHHLAATGLITTGASGFGCVIATSASFNSAGMTKLGLSVNGGAAFSGTNTLAHAMLLQP